MIISVLQEVMKYLTSLRTFFLTLQENLALYASRRHTR